MEKLNTAQLIEAIDEAKKKLKKQRKAPYEIWMPQEMIKNSRVAYDLYFNSKG
jgi:hypothetical protein